MPTSSRPFSLMLPAVGSSSRSSILASVDLPQPDSPTSARHCPARSSRLTPETACTVATDLKLAPRTWKCFTRSVTTRTGSPVPSGSPGGGPAACRRTRRCCRPRALTRGAVPQQTRPLPAGRRHRRRNGRRQRAKARPAPGRLGPAHVGRHWAAWRESAARPVADAGRRQPADRGQPVLTVLEQRKRGQQASGVRHPRLGEDRVDPAHLDCLARVHHQYAVGDAGHDAKVVTDHDHRGVRLPLDGLQQVEYLRLDGDVQRRGRLVRDQQFGLVCDRHRDHDALAHATGQLMREPARDRGRLGKPTASSSSTARF